MIVKLNLSDLEWLQVMLDLESLGAYELIYLNIKYRTHLENEKRTLLLHHLAQVN